MGDPFELWAQEMTSCMLGMAEMVTGMGEQRQDLSSDQNRLIEVISRGPRDDEECARRLESLLSAAAAKGKPINLGFHTASGSTLLVLAALANGAKQMQVLLKHGADPNQQTTGQDETGLHIAARYGYLQVAKVLLDAGANPLLLDCHGNSPLQLASNEEVSMTFGMTELKNSVPRDKRQLAALIKQHTDKYENHLRTRTASKFKGPGSSGCFASTGSSGTTNSSSGIKAASGAAAATAGDSAAPGVSSNTCDHCGKEPREGGKLLKCSRCRLRAYCGKECQLEDWPTHKAPCKLIADVKKRAAELMDTSQPPRTRWIRACSFGDNPSMQKIALDVKIIPQLLSAVENDQPILTGSLPTLLAITGLIRDMEAHSQPAGPRQLANKLHPVAVHQFVSAGGPVTVLKALKKHKLCEEQMVDGIRAISAVMHMWQVCKPLVKKGLATEIIQLLEPHVRSTHPKLVTNTAYCMMQLISTEQRLLQQEQEEQQGDHQQQQQDKQQDKQEQQEVLPPVLSAVLAHADLKCFLAAMGPEAQGSCPGNFYQACMEFFPVLIETRPAYKAFKTQQPALFRQMLDNAVCGIALVAPQALAAVLQTLYTVYRHGGVDVFYKELRPILLKYPEDWEGPQAEFVTTLESPEGHRDVTTLKPGEHMVCQGLFISCLLDAAESDTETFMLDLGPVKMWRTSALLLRAVWDSVPEVRPMYPDFMDRFETLESRRPRGSKDRDIITSIMLRMSTWQFCPAHGKTFPDHKSWMALVKKDPAAKTQLMQIMHQFFGQ